MDRIRLVVFVVLLGLVLLLMPLLPLASVPPSGAYAADLSTAAEPAAPARAAPEPASDPAALLRAVRPEEVTSVGALAPPAQGPDGPRAGVSEPVKPFVFEGDLRTLPVTKLWGGPTRYVPLFPVPRKDTELPGEKPEVTSVGALAPPAQGPDGPRAGVSEPVKPFVFEGDLRTLPVTKLWGGPTRYVPLFPVPRKDTELPGEKPVEGEIRDPLLQLQQLQPSLLQSDPNPLTDPIRDWDGMTRDQTGWLPPDTVGDVGPNHYIQMVNSHFQIFDKEGNSLAGWSAINSLWSGQGGLCDTQNRGDPIVLYDPLADRWMMSQFAFALAAGNPTPPYDQCIAISRTPDPVSGGWYLYDFQISAAPDEGFNDYPKFGVWPDAYYMSVNWFLGQDGVGLYAFDRNNMLGGHAATFQCFHCEEDSFGDPNNLEDEFSLLPSDLDGPPPPGGSPNTFVGMHQSDDDKLRYWDFQVDWSNPANTTLTGPTNISVTTFDRTLCGSAGACIDQPDIAQGLDEISSRLMWRLQYRNFGTHETLVTNHTVDVGSGQAGIRWYELRGGAGSWSLYQEGTHSPDTDVHRWMGSIAMDKAGNMALGYSVSNDDDLYPSVRYAGRLDGDTAGTLQSEKPISNAIGTGSQPDVDIYGRGRWGDYSSMNVDPADDCTFWYTQEYLEADGDWRTRITSFKTSPAEWSVNSTADTGDGNAGDGICDTGTIASPSGICTLRAAIQEANATVCVSDTIKFNIPLADTGCDNVTGVCTIPPLSALPVITDTVMIDGYTQPGAAPATGATNAVLKIVLDGSSAGNGVNGLVLQTDDSTIRGLAIHGFRVTNLASYDFSQGNGIVIREGMTNTITGNFIGTNVAGTACVGNGGSGVLIGGLNRDADADNNTVGGTSIAERNIISCNGFQDQTATGWDGVSIRVNFENSTFYTADGNQVLGNYIGTNVTGTMTLTAGIDISGTIHIGNTGNGVRIVGGSSNVISGTVGVAPNILSGNGLAGVRIEASPVFTREANSNVVQGNYIGTDVNGTADLGNLDVGVYIIGLADDADSNQIGGTTAAERNLISGNGASGVFIFGGLADNNTISGNYIGTDVNGTTAIPNDSGGVLIMDAEDNNIADNLISGNAGIGVSIINSADDGDADGNVIQGNYIGTEVSGTAALSNTLTGVVITDAANNDVGGTDTGAGNLISGNGEYGVIIMESGATGNDVQGNYIGTDFDGDAAIPNQGAGVLIINASGNTVGGSGNLISGNVLQGVRLIGADNNTVRDNLIGTRADGTSPLGNGSHGVVIADGNDNDIGVDGVFPQDNTIAHNGGDGVFVLSGTGNQILSNSIFDNDELGIDLGDDNVVTPNDDDDPDTGANNLQNYPVLTSASVNGNTTIEGVLNSTASTQFTVQFFANTACDPSGFGEGRTYLATDTTTTNASGDTTTSVTVVGNLTGQFITATATDPNGNTSEFSNCVEVGAEPVLTINKEVQDLNGGAVLPGDMLLYTISYTKTGNVPATGVLITDTYSISCTTISNVTTDLNFTTFSNVAGVLRWPATGGILFAAQASGSVRYRCTLQASFPAGTTDVENTATIDSDQTTPQQDTETVSVTVAPVLTIDKQVQDLNGGFTRPGDTLRYTINYANTGNAPASGVFITDDYSAFCATISNVTTDLNFTTVSDSAGVLRWPQNPTNTTTLAAGASGSLTYDCTLQASFPAGTTDVQNTATLDSNETSPQQDTVTVQVTAAPVLTIDKQVQDQNGGLAKPGDILTYTINYTNTGNAQATGVFITDDYSDLCDINITDDGDFPSHDDNTDRIRWPATGGIDLAAQASGSVSYECELQDPFPAGTTRVSNTSTIYSNETGPAQDRETLFTACYDFNGNGVVDVGDVMAVAVRWGLTAANPNPDGDLSTPNYEAKYDVNGDGVITVVDIMTVAAQWGRTC